MKSYYKLEISFNGISNTFSKIGEILEVKPTVTNFDDVPNSIPATWTYEVVKKDEDPYFDFINIFLDLLETKYKLLKEFNIQRSDITLWFLYEYDQQCNMEFDPVRLKRLGDNSIRLCISAWNSGDEYKMANEQGTEGKI